MTTEGPEPPERALDRVADDQTRDLEADELEVEEIARRVAVQMERYVSPHPHPEHLERYAALYPDAPKIVFDSFRDQGAHRRKMESEYMAGSERRANRGQWLAFILVLLVLGAGVFAISQDEATVGGLIIGAGFGGGVLLVIAGARSESRKPVHQGGPTQRGSAQAAAEVARRMPPSA